MKHDLMYDLEPNEDLETSTKNLVEIWCILQCWDHKTHLFQIQEPGGPTVLDVRSPQEFARGHLPGAKNLPLSPGRD